MFSHESDSEDEIPAGWEERISSNDRVYYVNHQTKTTQWHHPINKKQRFVNAANLPPGWRKQILSTGEVVFCNQKNSQITYTDPRIAFASDASKMSTYKELGPSSNTDDVLGNMDLHGKVAFITGANSGIGYETAKALASRGAHVILACRNEEKTNQCIGDILSTNASAKLTYLHCDLTSLESVRNCCENFLNMNLNLNMLILNAAVNSVPYTLTGDGIELTFQVNHLSHFFMTQLLEKKLIESSPSRIVFVSSESHRFSTINENNLHKEWSASNFISFMAYNDSKLFNILLANQLHRRLYSSNVTVVSCHPGNLVFTNIQRYWWLMRLLYLMAKPFTKTANQAASTVVHCTVSNEIEGNGGQYFNNCKECTPSTLATNEQLAKLLWDHCALMIQSVINDNKDI